MDMTTSTRVKEALGIAGSGSDTTIAQMVTAVSNEVERLMDRHAQTTARTEVYQMRATKRLVLLKGYPVDTGAAFTVKVSQNGDFTTADTLDQYTEYTLDATRGEIRFLGGYEPLRDSDSGKPIAPIYVQVTYTGGMATTANNFITAFPEISQAVDMQIVHQFKRRSTPGQTSTEMGDSSASYQAEVGLIKITTEAARRHRRMVWGG
jgi:hypothetical protein